MEKSRLYDLQRRITVIQRDFPKKYVFFRSFLSSKLKKQQTTLYRSLKTYFLFLLMMCVKKNKKKTKWW